MRGIRKGQALSMVLAVATQPACGLCAGIVISMLEQGKQLGHYVALQWGWLLPRGARSPSSG